MKNPLRLYQVVGERRNGDIVQIRKRFGKFTLKGKGRKRFTERESIRAKKWARRTGKFKGGTIKRVRTKYPFLILDSDTRHARARVARRLNKVAGLRRRYFFVNEGWRTHQRQWELWRQYGPGRAAYPGTSRHESGNAVDVQVIMEGRSGWRRNIGEESKARQLATKYGFRWTVAGEPWHIEL